MSVYPLEAWLTILVMGASVLLATTLCACVAVGLAPSAFRMRSHDSRRVRRAGRRFAELVAAGDYEAAEAAIGDACGPRTIEWDERTVLDVPLDEARRELTDPVPLATWFPEVRRVTRGDTEEIVLGRGEPIRIAVLSETWNRDLDGMVLRAVCDACSVTGYLSLRTKVLGVEGSVLRTTVEVTIHMEALDAPGARQALARARLITHDGLERMAEGLNTG